MSHTTTESLSGPTFYQLFAERTPYIRALRVTTILVLAEMTDREFQRLMAYRGAVQAGLYSDWNVR